jgi:hypothetical protein
MRVRLFFRNEFFSRFFEHGTRFILPIVVVSMAKFAGAIVIARGSLPVVGGKSLGYWSKTWGVAGGWWIAFSGWDTGWYGTIVRSWYPPSLKGQWAFFPLFPFLGRLLNLFVANPLEALAIVSLFFGVAWVPLFQLVAENYMDRNDAFWCTLLTAFFPIVFLYTTVAYSEPLFLFMCLATWQYYLKGKMLQSAIFAALATLTRTYGIAIIIPVALDLLSKRKWRKMMWIAIPVLALASWALYFVMNTGHLFLWEPLYLFWGQKPWSFEILRVGDPSTSFRISFLALFFCLAFWTWKVDWRLSTYTLILSSVILANSGMWSGTRYLSFLFPVWLNLKFKNSTMSLILILFFYFSALPLWNFFQRGMWVS